MALQEYKRKRNFKETPEPRGRVGKKGAIYVIQKHDATRLHYDLRLQLDGVLKSWAVPKGPSLDPHEKRLAVEVEDHPIDYATFEGVIPKGYGAGEVIVWDYGTWAPAAGHDPRKDLKKGRLDFEIRGEKLHGRWMLVRTRSQGGKPQWLLMKRTDSDAKKESDYDVTEEEKESVLSGRRLARDSGEAPIQVKHTKRTAKKPAAKSKKLPIDFVEPELALLENNPPEGDEWIHEMKFDGYRTLAQLENGDVTLLTRKGLNWTQKYKPIQKELEKLPVENALLDGEIVVLDEKGRSNFQLLQENIKSRKMPFIYYVFDLLALDGEDLRDQPLLERKKKLKSLLDKNKLPSIRYSEHWTVAGEEVLDQCCHLGLEGVVSKDKTKPYVSGRNGDWIKSKCGMGQEFVIIGYTRPGGRRVGFGSLLLGAYDDSDELIYTGHVGTGFSQATLQDLITKFKPLKTKKSPVNQKVPEADEVQWLKPQLVADVHFLNFTREGILRHASFAGLRLDKPAREVKLDLLAKPTSSKKKAEAKKSVKKTKAAKSTLKLSNPTKVLIPQANVTKQEIAEYYLAVAKWMLPHVVDRPLALVRCPDGISKECFFQKSLHDAKIHEVFEEKRKGQKGKSENVIYIESAEGLLGLTQMGVLEIHTWQTHRDNFLNPDQLIFDLDPGPGVNWKQIANAALDLKELLSQLKLQSFLKTSGGKGLHIHVPIEPAQGWDEFKAFANAMARYMAEKNPKLYLAVMSKSKRQKKIFIDYLRNGYGATAIVAYGLRARAEAGLAIPIDWDEIHDVKPDGFTIKNYQKTILKRKKDPWARYFKVKQRLPFDELEEMD